MAISKRTIPSRPGSEDVRRTYFARIFHTHFVMVHLVGLLFGLHMAIASGFAMLHHGRRVGKSGSNLAPAGVRERRTVVSAIMGRLPGRD